MKRLVDVAHTENIKILPSIISHFAVTAHKGSVYQFKRNTVPLGNFVD